MEIYNDFQIDRAFTSPAGPVWVCRQVYEGHEGKTNFNPQIVFWHNTMLRNRRGTDYHACWENYGGRYSGLFLILFVKGYIPWIGSYQVLVHLDRIPMEEVPIYEALNTFDPMRARLAQSRLKLAHLMTSQQFFERYMDIQGDLIPLDT